jgi:hypothetical protein
MSSTLLSSTPTQLDPVEPAALLFWNKETDSFGNYDDIPIVKTAKIVSISRPNDPDNALLHDRSQQPLPMGCELVQIVSSVDDIQIDQLLEVNGIFCSFLKTAREPLAYLIEHLPNLEWIHCRQTGIDYLHSETLKGWTKGIMTNAKGQFSSTLAEYALGAMTYFAKDFPRLQRSKATKTWHKYVSLTENLQVFVRRWCDSLAHSLVLLPIPLDSRCWNSVVPLWVSLGMATLVKRRPDWPRPMG